MLHQVAGWIELVLLLAAGVLVRALLLAVVIGALAVPIVMLLYGWRGVRGLIDGAMGLRRVGHIRLRDGCYYTPAHLWVKPVDDRRVRIGLDDLAQRLLPDLAAVSLGAPGRHVGEGEPIGEVRCRDEWVTLKAPFAGTIARINGRVVAHPELVHEDPYRRAWLVDVAPDDERYASYRSGAQASAWLREEDRRLTEIVEHDLGIAAADGGELTLPASEVMDQARLHALRTKFLQQAA